MQKLMKALEEMMIAVTFAEAGEFDEAKKLSLKEEEEAAAVEAVRVKA
ncbi:MAG: hypothetical protein M0042_15180 [Nitrospiraceae bacterium]|nr:hypothetical protein [Nitrospiraceae bacterium]